MSPLLLVECSWLTFESYGLHEMGGVTKVEDSPYVFDVKMTSRFFNVGNLLSIHKEKVKVMVGQDPVLHTSKFEEEEFTQLTFSNGAVFHVKESPTAIISAIQSSLRFQR